jgi:hypothetical protein
MFPIRRRFRTKAAQQAHGRQSAKDEALGDVSRSGLLIGSVGFVAADASSVGHCGDGMSDFGREPAVHNTASQAAMTSAPKRGTARQKKHCHPTGRATRHLVS